jgi:hypothetical protein
VGAAAAAKKRGGNEQTNAIAAHESTSSIWCDGVPYSGTMCPKFDAAQQSGKFQTIQSLMVYFGGD